MRVAVDCIQDGYNGLVDNTAESVAEKIKLFALDSRLAITMGQNHYKFVSKNFSKSIFYAKFSNQINRLNSLS